MGAKDIAELKQAMGCFATGVTVVTTHFQDQDWGMTCNSFNTVSLQPAMVMWSIRNNAASFRAFTESSGYVVSVLSQTQQDLAMKFAQSSQQDRFSGVELERLQSKSLRLLGCVAWFECTIERLVPAGDHTMLIGNVINIGSNAHPPLVYCQRQFGGFLK